MAKKKKATKKVKKKKEVLKSGVVTINPWGREEIRCPHCGNWDYSWLGELPGNYKCEECEKELVVLPLRIQDKLLMEQRQKDALKERLLSEESKVSDLQREVKILRDTPWNKAHRLAKRKYKEYRAKPKQIWEDFKGTDGYKVPRMHYRRMLYKPAQVHRVKETVHGFEVILNIVPSLLGKKLKYPEFRKGYKHTREYGWRRIPFYPNPPINKGFQKYLDKLVKQYKIDNL
jgi:DNA-directed RNA polymerase subunit RPC12/RpoP